MTGQLKTFFDGRLAVKVGDLTRETCDCIVNAANASLLGGGGVDGAIHRVGGPAIVEECRSIRKERYPRGLPTGQAVMTTGGNLAAKSVIHTVGPIWGEHADTVSDKLLADSYHNSLELAASKGYLSIAFPAISTGIFGFPKPRAAKIVSKVMSEWLPRHENFSVALVFFSEGDYASFLAHCEL